VGQTENADQHSSISSAADEATPAASSVAPAATDQPSKLVEPQGNEIVLLGGGLDAIWLNEESLEWQLWQNIMQAFGWDESQVVFYDTEHLASEEMVFSTMEEVIELGVDWVLTMDAEHIISEQLAEGVQVVEVPDLDLMLSDPYAKQSFYQTVIALPQAEQ
jgi:hypothetical protein